MFDVVDVEILDQYVAKIEKYAGWYGPAQWPLVYQTEARTRLEQAGQEF